MHIVRTWLKGVSTALPNHASFWSHRGKALAQRRRRKLITRFPMTRFSIALFSQRKYHLHCEDFIMSNASRNLALKLNPLRPLAERIATVRSPTHHLYSYFLSASFVKAFEFVDLVSEQKSENAFFLVPALRGITEDIIYLHFLSRFDHDIRQQVLHNMIQLEAEKQLTEQNLFFQRFRPFQPVLPSAVVATDKMREQLLSFWQNNGWPS